MNIDLELFAECSPAKQLSLNIKKTNYIIFTNRRIDFNRDIGSLSQEIRVKSTKFLGLIIDGHTSWKEHMDVDACKVKPSSTLYILREVKNYIAHSCLKSLYVSMFYPYLA